MTGSPVGMDVRVQIAAWPPESARGAVTAFCRAHKISRSQFYAIRKIAREGGQLEAVTGAAAGRERPDRAVDPVLVAAAVRIRKELADAGWDHGPVTVRHQMIQAGLPAPSRATLARIFAAHGMVVPQPQKRPRSSYRRFTFGRVHECWQLDATEWRLADGTKVTIFQLLDDHSRYIVGSWVDTGETSAAAVEVFIAATAAHQVPQLLLTDNGLAMNPHRRGKVSALAAHTATLGVTAITCRVQHPQTVGKNERVHQTLKRWLRVRPAAASIPELTEHLAEFDAHYNQRRPHQALEMATPAHVLTHHPRAVPPQPPTPPPTATTGPRPPRRPGRRGQPIRTLKVMPNGCVRVGPYDLGLGTEYRGRTVIAVIEDPDIALYDSNGTLLRTVRVTPGTRHYGTGRPRGGNRRRAPSTMNTTNSQLSGPTETEPSGDN
jgi:transposase InsO family protein